MLLVHSIVENLNHIPVILLILLIISIVTLPRLPPTHLEYSFVDSLAFEVRGLEFRRLAVTNISQIVVVGVRSVLF